MSQSFACAPTIIGLVMPTVEGGMLCQQEIVRHAARAGLPFPTIISTSLSSAQLRALTVLLKAGNYASAAPILVEAVERVERAGATVCAIPANLAHYAFDFVRSRVHVRMLSIVDAVIQEVRSRSLSRIALLGTLPVMEGALYRQPLAAQGVEVVVPDTPARQFIDRTIFDELIRGTVNPQTQAEYSRMIDRFATERVDAVVLCCTELGMVVKGDASIEVLDSTIVLAQQLIAPL